MPSGQVDHPVVDAFRDWECNIERMNESAEKYINFKKELQSEGGTK